MKKAASNQTGKKHRTSVFHSLGSEPSISVHVEENPNQHLWFSSEQMFLNQVRIRVYDSMVLL